MTCQNSDDKYFAHQEHRHISRLWKKAIEKQSLLGMNIREEFENPDMGRRCVHFDQNSSQLKCECSYDPEDEKKKIPSETIQKKLLKGKSAPRVKSPLQKFDEIVTRELLKRRISEERGMHSFDSSKQWSGLQFTRIQDFGSSKITLENKVSRGALDDVEKEVRKFDITSAQNAALMDAIEKLAQAQAFCHFDAAVKAAEAATASVPLEMAEEVAVACAKDYQSEIVDVINKKIPLSEEKKPIEVIGLAHPSGTRDQRDYKSLLTAENHLCKFFGDKPEKFFPDGNMKKKIEIHIDLCQYEF